MTAAQIGYLVPLNRNLEEDNSVPKLPISSGSNVIGRNSISLPDKRLSRKHLTLVAAVDGSTDLVVEGTNPVVVKSADQRKKLSPGDKAKIVHGDIIELLPGDHFFKYVTAAGGNSGASLEMQKNSSKERRELCEGELRSVKRAREEKSDEASECSQTEVEINAFREEGSLGSEKSEQLQSKTEYSSSNNGSESIRSFSLSDDKLTLTFRLLRVQGLPAWANNSSVSIRDVIQGNVLVAVLSNYMVDIDWLIPACPILSKIPHVLIIHGEGDARLDYMKVKKPANWILHKPRLPISFGTHHSKAMLLVYPRGVRVIVHTANLIYVDWNNKSQGLWMQDFPWKDKNSAGKGCGFENDLTDYLSALKWPEFSANIPALGNIKINSSFFKKFDYTDAAVRLIASVPGYHVGPCLKKWGHMKLRAVLEDCFFDKEFQKSPLIYQFSSLGSLDEKWMAELATSMSSGYSADKKPLGLGDPMIIWPTVEDVRQSLEGYAAGNAIPSPLKNVEKQFLKKYWAKWKASHTGRCRAMPHIKTFTRYDGQNIAWFLLTSANLSKAAWGALQKNNSQLMIRSYELGVLFLPSLIKQRGLGFSCTDDGSPLEDKYTIEKPEVKRTKMVTLNWKGVDPDSSSEIIRLPVPYELPPRPYSSEDIPWSWDRRYYKKDVYGEVWPRQVKLYVKQDP